MLLALLSTCVAASRLTVPGETSDVLLGRAAISSTCGGSDVAQVKYLAPRVSDDPAKPIRAHLHGVPHTCIGASLDVPCVSPERDYPALFYAAWSGADAGAPDDEYIVGPLHAASELEDSSGLAIGFRTFLDCPPPPVLAAAALLGRSTFPISGNLSLSIRHFAPSGAASLALPFRGLPDGNTVHLLQYSMPPSMPPSLPPSQPQLLELEPAVDGVSMLTAGEEFTTASTSLLTLTNRGASPLVLRVRMWGGGGGGMSHSSHLRTGGSGGYVSGEVTIAPGAKIYAQVGSGGGAHRRLKPGTWRMRLPRPCCCCCSRASVAAAVLLMLRLVVVVVPLCVPAPIRQALLGVRPTRVTCVCAQAATPTETIQTEAPQEEATRAAAPTAAAAAVALCLAWTCVGGRQTCCSWRRAAVALRGGAEAQAAAPVARWQRRGVRHRMLAREARRRAAAMAAPRLTSQIAAARRAPQAGCYRGATAGRRALITAAVAAAGVVITAAAAVGATLTA